MSGADSGWRVLVLGRSLGDFCMHRVPPKHAPTRARSTGHGNRCSWGRSMVGFEDVRQGGVLFRATESPRRTAATDREGAMDFIFLDLSSLAIQALNSFLRECPHSLRVEVVS